MLVSVTELRRYVQGDPDLMNEASASYLLAVDLLKGAQNELERYLLRSVEPVHLREAVAADGRGKLFLSEEPVWKINSIRYVWSNTNSPVTSHVTVIGPFVPDTTPGGSYDLVKDVTALQFMSMQNSPWPGLYMPDGTYVVDYIGGLNGYRMQDIKTAITRVVAREFSRVTDNSVSLLQDNGERAKEMDTRASGWTDDELFRFDHMRRRVVVT